MKTQVSYKRQKYYTNANQKKGGVAMLLLYKLFFRTRKTIIDKKIFHSEKSSNYQEDIILNVVTHNQSLKNMKQNKIKIKKEGDGGYMYTYS